MFPQLQQRWRERDSETSFTLAEVEDFPLQDYNELKQAYLEAERWFTGQKLEATNQDNDELYPLKVNPIIGTCLKHAYMLFGEPQDDGRPMVYPKLSTQDESQKELVGQAEYALNKVWSQSGGRALLIEGGVLSQIYGGAIIKINWDGRVQDPNNPYAGATLENIPAPNFYGIPYPGQPYRMREAWIIKKVSRSQAKGLGYPVNQNTTEKYWMVEHWTENRYTQKINGDYLVLETSKGKRPLAGANQFGAVPIVYIPHLRVGTFFGINTFDHLLGLIKEINLRYADYGDAVNDDSHSNIAMRNVTGTPELKPIGGGIQVIDLGSSRDITGNEKEPDLFEVSETAKASTAMESLTEVLYDQYRRDAAHPAVADGEDEGSQRSGLTIAMRFWPMTSHVGTERYFWTPGLNRINKLILKILAEKRKGEITKEHLKLDIKQKWAPMLPRDREAQVQEWVNRASANIGSLDTLLEQTGDIEDIEEEKEKILDWLKRVAEIEAEVNARYGNVVDESSEDNENTEEEDEETQEE